MAPKEEYQIDLVLPTRKRYEDGKGIDINLICSLKEIKRCPSFSIHNKFSVAEHLWLCGILVPRYCDYIVEKLLETEFVEHCTSDKFRYQLMQTIITHDLEEVIFNDIPAPIFLPQLDYAKEQVRISFRKFLNIDFAIDSKEHLEVLNMCAHHIDCLAALIELNWYMKMNGVENVIDLYAHYEVRCKNHGTFQLFEKLKHGV